jgi:transposase
MRGEELIQNEIFSCVTLEQRVPQDHPLREIRKLTDAVLVSLNDEFDALYSVSGRPSIAPEYVLRALLLQVFYSIRSERQLVEQLNYNLLFRWFVGLGMDDAVWNHAVFSKNRDRLLTSELAQRFFAEVSRLAKRFMSDEHFTVDGTLIQAWASQKSFRKKDGSDDGDGTNFHGQLRQGVQTGVSRSCAGGEPQWPDRGRDGYPGRWTRRARRRSGNARLAAKRQLAAHHRGCRQGLRRKELHRRSAFPQRHRSCAEEREGTPLEPGRKNHPALWICAQPQPALANREDLRLAQADRPTRSGEAARSCQGGLGLRLQLRRPQPAPAAKAHCKPAPTAALRLRPG